VVGKLIEGQNLVDIDCGVIAQLGGTQRITVQEAGRIMRSLNPEIFILVFDDTKDESFLYTLTSSIPAQYIKHYKF
jgi:superfamily II DNA or RNA helicase